MLPLEEFAVCDNAMDTNCRHYEKIEDVEIQGQFLRFGTCRKCGRVKWYDTINQLGPSMIIKPGGLQPETSAKGEIGKVAKFTGKKRKELLALGVDEFMIRHNYGPQARSGLLQAYNKGMAKKKGKPRLRSGPQVLHLPPLLVEVISVLPPEPKEIPEDSRTRIKNLICSAVDFVYGKKELPCRDRRSGPGGP